MNLEPATTFNTNYKPKVRIITTSVLNYTRRLTCFSDYVLVVVLHRRHGDGNGTQRFTPIYSHVVPVTG